jgi:outer membrane lipoprotein carrier protein
MRALLSILLLCICSLTWGAEPAPANTNPVDELIAELQGMNSLEGNFTQILYDDSGELLMQSSGNFRLLRPGFFSWEILTPDNQLVIANPEFVWHHDRDLDTVTRRPANAGENLAPLQILGGEEEALRQHYQVEGGAGQYSLTPLQDNAGFQQLQITLAKLGPTRMVINDNLQQRVVIDFQNLASPETLGAEDFSFSPPAESDVFYYDE